MLQCHKCKLSFQNCSKIKFWSVLKVKKFKIHQFLTPKMSKSGFCPFHHNRICNFDPKSYSNDYCTSKIVKITVIQNDLNTNWPNPNPKKYEIDLSLVKKVQFSELHIHVKVSEGLLTRKDFAVKKFFFTILLKIGKNRKIKF